MAIQLFMQATLLLAHYYHFDTIQYSEVRARAARSGLSTLPFMPPETVHATPEMVSLVNAAESSPEAMTQLANQLVQTYGYKPIVKYYIRTGLRASQLICRNYLLQLEENNRYLEFLRREFGVAYTLATSVLLAADANQTLTNAFSISRNFLDGGLNAYEEYRFLTIDREAARVLVETAQNKFAEHFMQQVDLADKDSTATAGGFTFSDAIHAVSVIEYQCTREGIQGLLTRSVNNTPTNMGIDSTTGTVIFRSATIVDPAEGKKTAAAGRNGATPAAVDPTTPPPQPVRTAPKGGQPSTDTAALQSQFTRLMTLIATDQQTIKTLTSISKANPNTPTSTSADKQIGTLNDQITKLQQDAADLNTKAHGTLKSP